MVRWGLIKINAPGAWDITTGSSNIIVGVLDTGIDTSHPEFPGRINTALGRNFTDDTVGMTDPVGHGTHVAGIIGAAGNNGVGVSGVNWNVTMVSLRVFKNNGSGGGTGTTAWLRDGINYAQNNNISILNHSGGGYTDDQSVLAAVNNYTGLFVCSAGNDSYNTDINGIPHYPSSYTCDNLISVGASDSSDNIVSFSNYGKTSVDLFAPGSGILSTYPVSLGSYINMDGTSMATPMVTGVAALIKSINPNLSAAQIKSYILNNVDIVAAFSGKCVTGGRLNAYKAVKGAASYYTPLSAGDVHSVVVKSNGTVWTWGDNYYGQLGNGSTILSLTPVQVSGLSGIVSVAAGMNHTMALKSDGTVWA